MTSGASSKVSMGHAYGVGAGTLRFGKALRRSVSISCSVKDDQNGSCVSVRSISMAAMLAAAVVTAGRCV